MEGLKAIAELAELGDYTFAFLIRAVAAIGVADHLEDGPKSIEELAARTACSRDGLLRAMQALVTKSVFTEGPGHSFGLAPLGELLRTNHPLSMRWFFRHEPDVQALAALEYSVRTGTPSFNHLFGVDYFEWIGAHEEARERFRESQRALNRLELLLLSRVYPWREIGSIVDIGGNDGALLATLMQRHPTLRGTLFDLPEIVADAAEIFAAAGVSDRATIVAGDVVNGGVPAGADLYAMKRVLVGFSDQQAMAALSHVRAAMAPHSRLLILEPTRSSGDRAGLSLDVRMLALGMGRVRSAEEFAALLTSVELDVKSTRNAGLLTIVEAALRSR